MFSRSGRQSATLFEREAPEHTGRLLDGRDHSAVVRHQEGVRPAQFISRKPSYNHRAPTDSSHQVFSRGANRHVLFQPACLLLLFPGAPPSTVMPLERTEGDWLVEKRW
jgi:hypothetical protein